MIGVARACVNALKGGGGGGGGGYYGCTFDAATAGAGLVLSNGNLTAYKLAGSNANVTGTIFRSTGKHYFEVTYDSGSSNYVLIGLTTSGYNKNSLPANDTTPVSAGWQSLGYYRRAGLFLANMSIMQAGDVIMLAVDLDVGAMWVGKNGIWNEGNPSLGSGSLAFWDTELAGLSMAPIIQVRDGAQLTANFGSSAFVHPVPTGFN